MRFGLVHRVMTDSLAALGLLALITSGELDRWMSIGLLVGLVGALAIPERWQERDALHRLGVVAPLALFLLQGARLAMGGSTLRLAVEFAAGLQVLRLATRRGAAHDQQVIVLALLHLIAGTVLGGGLAYGLCFLGFLVVAPGALVLSHLRREVEGNYRQGARDRTGLPVDVPRILRSRRVIGRPFLLFTCSLSVPIFVFTGLLFLLFPRVGLSFLLVNHGRPQRMVGFSDRVDLGKVGRLRQDPTIAMRVAVNDLGPEPPPRLAMYLRGTAFDHYDGKSWVRTRNRRRVARRHGKTIRVHRYPRPEDRRLTIDLEPFEPPVVFLPENTIALELTGRRAGPKRSLPRVFRKPAHELQYSAPEERGMHYTAIVASSRDRALAVRLTEPQRRRYLTLPPNLPQRVKELAARWAGKGTDLAQARRVEHRLRTDYRYDVDSPSGGADNPLDHFLFESKRGHCEFYSTAMAVMLRTRGIPTRNVTGFIGGSYNRFGKFYAVRQGDAHSWVEVHIEGVGWKRYDPTPPASAAPQSELTGFYSYLRDIVEAAAQRWDRNVLGYDLKQQFELFRTVKRRFDALKASSPLADRVLGTPRQAALLLLGLILVAVGGRRAYRYWRRRRRTSDRPVDGATRREAVTVAIVDLYRHLDQALAASGVPRPASVTPLAHAESLQRQGHPWGDDVRDITQTYLEVRFGHADLEDDDLAALQRQVHELVRSPAKPPPAEQDA